MVDIPVSGTWHENDASNIVGGPPSWPPNSAPTIVYNNGRATMGAIRREWDRNNPTVSSTSSGDAYVLTYTVAPAGYVRGMRFSFIADHTNTGAATLNVNGLGAIAIQANGGALAGGEIRNLQVIEMFYDGTVFQIPTSVPAANLVDRHVYPTAGTTTYTAAVWVRAVFVEVQGGGGGGGGCALTGGAQVAAGAPGGGGGYACKLLTTGFTGGITIIIGAGGAGASAGANNGADGGDSSFGALLTGNHGVGGAGSIASAVPQLATAGAGGTGVGTGSLALAGGDGGSIINNAVSAVMSGAGGAPGGPFGPGAPSQTASAGGAAGKTAANPGGGGSGGVNCENQGTAHSGGAGHDGIVILWEFA